jgi:hypothetical protein
MRVRAICCEIIYREACMLAAKTPHVVDLDFLPKGLHDIGAERMSARLQEKIDEVDPEVYDATLLGYALCNNGTAGLVATRTKLVVPRAHDCITFFMGSRERYKSYFDAHPGTYFRTTGWSERGEAGEEDGSIHDQLGTNSTWQEYVEKYGEDNAKYIMESLGGWRKVYTQMTYIDMGLPPDEVHAEAARGEADDNGWTFDHITGDWTLLEKMFRCDWTPDDFLVLEKGQAVEASYDDCIFRCGCGGKNE